MKHALAVLIGFLRRPGRFSLWGYPREEALERLAKAKAGWVLDLGSSGDFLGEHVIALDLNPYPGVDLVANAECLPFGNQVCEGVWMNALLEHVAFPKKVLEEARRVLKPGGWVYAEVPFLQGEHDAPGSDFRRWTREGLRQLFEDWEIDWVDVSSGPFSALAYQLRSCLSLLTSFGSDTLYRVLHEAVWSYVVWPIHFLDIFFRTHPRAREHAFGFAIMARRKETGAGHHAG